MNPHALVAGSARVAWRRAIADRGLVLGAFVLLVVTAFLALTGPRLVGEAADAGARGAERDAGARADIVANLGSTVAPRTSSSRDDAAATKLRNTANDMRARLPAEIAGVTGEPSAAVRSGRLMIRSGDQSAVARFAWLWSTADVGVTWVEGRAPQASPPPAEQGEPGTATTEPVAPRVRLVEVGLTRADADAIGAHVGDQISITGTTRGIARAVVSGIYAAADSADPLWTTVPGLLEPTAVGAGGVTLPSLGLLLSDESLPDLPLALQPGAITTSFRFPADGSSLTAADVERVRARVTALSANPTTLTVAGSSTPTVVTELDTVLGDFEARLRGAQALASVLLVGLVTIGALALLLAARLVVGRRQTLLAAERARGASAASVALRLALESVPLAVVGVGLGALGSWLVNRDAPWTWWPGILVGLVAVLAVPVGGARLASTSWTGQRSPANRKDRDRLRGRRRARRTVVELAVFALALAATSAARGRGLQQTQTQGVDLLLAAAPMLLACAATIVVLRLFPAVLRLLVRSAARRRGLVPLVATARATRTGSIGLPLLALTIALGLVVFSGITATSTQRGEERAAVETVGADVRLDGVVTPDALTTLRASGGVTAVAEGTRLSGRTFNGSSGSKVTVLMVDAAAYDTIAAAHDSRYAGELADLGSDAGAGDPPRAVVSAALAGDVAVRGASVFVGGATVVLDVVGTTDLGRPGESLVIVDRTALAPFTPDPVEPDLTWVDGSGASGAVAALQARRALPGVTVTDRAVWLEHVRASPLVGSVVTLLTVAAFVLALYAAVALVLTVVATSTERGRTLSSLRTLGLDRGATWRITLGELAPMTASGVLAGATIGLCVPLALSGALGLQQLTGEARVTAVALTAGPFLLAIAAGLVALAVSVAVEAVVRRHENLGEILRVGDR
ncbi:MAG: FtsX-like permease family protein [Cellulomonas sp.]